MQTPMKSLLSLAKRALGHREAGILRNGGYGLAAKLATTLNLFSSMPFVRESAGAEVFGAWATIVSVATFAAFLDFGLSSGAMNLVAGAHGRGNSAEVTALSRIALRILCINSLALAVAGIAVVALAPWDSLLGLGEATKPLARTAVGIAITSMILAVPAGLALRIQLGTGDASAGYRFATVGQLIACTATIVAAKVGASLPILVACTLLPPVLAAILNTMQWARNWPLSCCKNQLADAKSSLAADIRRESWLFMTLQISAVAVHTSDLPLISALIGADEAGQYAVAQRLFLLIPIGMGLLWTPLWPTYRQALARSEYKWVVRTLRWTAFLALIIASLTSATLAIGFKQVTQIWMGAPLGLSTLLLTGFATWAALDAAGGAYGAFLNAASPRWLLIAISTTFAASSLILKTWAASKDLIELMPWATLSSFLVFDLLPFLLFWPKLVKHMQSRKF
ncbi:MAG: hypothetical protein E6Q40_08685 [Cupriavidus sp.]|nr:MAG: hypothetical protein E6Q40_08685 [Cupriavidus sp.]